MEWWKILLIFGGLAILTNLIARTNYIKNYKKNVFLVTNEDIERDQKLTDLGKLNSHGKLAFILLLASLLIGPLGSIPAVFFGWVTNDYRQRQLATIAIIGGTLMTIAWGVVIFLFINNSI